MCQICLQTPCNQQCPNAVAKVAHNCTMCDGDILLGEDYYLIYNEPWCEECTEDAKQEAEEWN